MAELNTKIAVYVCAFHVAGQFGAVGTWQRGLDRLCVVEEPDLVIESSDAKGEEDEEGESGIGVITDVLVLIGR